MRRIRILINTISFRILKLKGITQTPEVLRDQRSYVSFSSSFSQVPENKVIVYPVFLQIVFSSVIN